MNLSNLNLAKVSVDTVALKGGFDQMTPSLELAAGAAREIVNYECPLTGGYMRVSGYERYDGRTSPSSVTFKILPIATFLNTPAVGNTLTGGTSGATGVIIAVGTTYVIVTRVLVATFQPGEMTDVSGTVIGTIGPQTITLTKRQRKQYVKAASDVYRALISAVPGYGPVRGVFGATFSGAFTVYAFRDYEHLGSFRASRLWKATTGGWVGVGTGPLFCQGLELEFYQGSGTVPVQGDTWTFASYGNYTIQRVLLTSGSWAGGTAAGRIIFNYGGGPGAFHQSFNPQTYNGTTIRTRNSLNTNQPYPGGSYEFAYGNFSGQLSSSRVFGCDGVNRSFEFDGSLCIPITTGIEQLGWSIDRTIVQVDKPTHIAAHHNHLMVAIGSSIIHSAIGDPYNWEAGNGAGEIVTGSTITGFVALPGSQQTGSLGVYGRNKTQILYGTALAGTSPFSLVSFGGEFGALARTILQMEDAYSLDDRGLTRLKTAQEFGNFVASTLTRNIQRYINGRTGRAVFAILNRTRGQYRLFFNDKTGLYVTIANGKLIGIGRTSYAHTFTVGWSGEDASGTEHAFVGDSDGFVHELDRGTSQDGGSIDASLILNWNTFKSPRVRKTIRSAVVDIHATDYAELTIGARLGPDIGAHLQDVPSDPVTMTTDVPVITDTFNRADAATLGASWLNPFAQPCTIAGNTCHGVLATASHQVHGTALSSADQWVEATIVQLSATTEQCALTVREDGSGVATHYTLMNSPLYGGSWIAKVVANVFQYNIGFYPIFSEGDRMRLECRTVSGVVQFKAYRNNVLHFEEEDATVPILTGSYVGIVTYQPTGVDTVLDDFRAGTFLDTVVDRTISTTPTELTPQWDHFTWDDFYWDAHSEAPLEVDVTGTADRVQWAIQSSSDYLDPHTLTSITTHYVTRRTLR